MPCYLNFCYHVELGTVGPIRKKSAILDRISFILLNTFHSRHGRFSFCRQHGKHIYSQAVVIVVAGGGIQHDWGFIRNPPFLCLDASAYQIDSSSCHFTSATTTATAIVATVVVAVATSAITRTKSHNNTIINHSMHMRIE